MSTYKNELKLEGYLNYNASLLPRVVPRLVRASNRTGLGFLRQARVPFPARFFTAQSSAGPRSRAKSAETQSSWISILKSPVCSPEAVGGESLSML